MFRAAGEEDVGDQEKGGGEGEQKHGGGGRDRRHGVRQKTTAETIDKVEPVELSKNVAALATVAYVLVDMPLRLREIAPPHEGAAQ